MTEIQVHDSAIRTVRLERFEADDEDDAAATIELLAAADELSRGWLVPLGVALRVECLDPDNFMQASQRALPTHPHWFLRCSGLPSDVPRKSPIPIRSSCSNQS